jgi:periplasmic protein TonB
MFHTLETTWDQSARRGWTAVASFTLQAFALSLLLLIPMLTIQAPPKLAWFDPHLLAPPPPLPAPAPPQRARAIQNSNMSEDHLLEPPSIPNAIVHIDDHGVLPAPEIGNIGATGGTGGNRPGIPDSIGIEMSIAPPPLPAPTRPLRISHWAEGNLIYRVQPLYPQLARQARVQGIVELRAIISKTGTIERLTVLSGHALLVTAAVEAVKQWRYRPYFLNAEPIEVETEITVNFTLATN